MFSQFLCFLVLSTLSSGIEDSGFIYNNFRNSSVRFLDDASVGLDGIATITEDGALRLTTATTWRIGRAFYTKPLQFKNSSNGTLFSFSTTFVFAILPGYPDVGGHGIAFFISPPSTLASPRQSQYLGLFNETNNGNSSNHVLAVELDTILNFEFEDIDDNHVGIDINGLHSVVSAPASYYTSVSKYKNLSLISGEPMQVWIDYDWKMQVAVKRISDGSKQGIKEFVAEIVTLGQLRHRNLVQLLGYCRRKGELLLVYDYMPNGSLDKLLFGQLESQLNWRERFHIIKGVASGLVYLHEEWDQVVIHRDIKASNVLLDSDFTGKLSDFGLARLYKHGTNPQTTHAAGTFGYLAPEMARSGKATMATDAYSFGAFLLEVACGRRPIEVLDSNGNIILVDWVIKSWRKGEILETADPKLGSEYVKEEMELVLKLGLLCSQTKPSARPTMRHILQCLENEFSLQGLSHECLAFGDDEENSDYPPEMMNSSSTSVADSLLSTGR